MENANGKNDSRVEISSSEDSSWQVAYRQFRKNKLAMLGVTLILVLSGVAVLAPLLANGRPLFIRGYLTQVYDNDAAAFSDWHGRLRDTALQLRVGVPARERDLFESRYARYQKGLPEAIDRLAQNLPTAQAAELKRLGAEYTRVVKASYADLDLAGYDALGEQIESQFCALSITSAYKRAAGPLLVVPDLLEEARQVQETRDDPRQAATADGRLARVAKQAAGVSSRSQAGVLHVLTFLDEDQRATLNAADAKVRVALVKIGEPDADLASIGARTLALEDLLDRLADQPVSPARQQLPLVTRWPVFRSLTGIEIAFIVFYLCVLIDLALWRWLSGFRPTFLGTLLPAVVAWILWGALVPPVQLPSESLYKTLAKEMSVHPEIDRVSAVVFPIVPFGENENIHADRVTAPALWERFGPEAQRVSLARRLQSDGEEPVKTELALSRLTRLRSHWLGTDDNGRDVLARLIYGSRVSLSVGFVAVGIYVLIGIIVGALAGYFGGWVDVFLMRITELVMCFPSFFLIITVMSIIEKPRIEYIMIVIGITRWTEVMRLVRGEFLRLRSQDFVTAAQALGLPPARVVFRHILPNAIGPVFVAATFGVAGAILIESALSFLGFGVPQPTASWGSVLNVAFGHEQQMWWITIFAGFLIFLTVTAYNLAGEGLRDALDPKLRQ